MKRLTMVFAIALLVAALGAIPVFAASSGNFSATGTSASCVICNGTSNPACTGTLGNGNFAGGTTLSSFAANISTSNGNGVTLDIRPDLVTGLFTDTKISTTVPSATAEIGIQVCVTVDGSGKGVLPASCVIYDERFQQISSQLFSQLAACTAAPTGTTCTSNTAGTACGTGNTCQLGTSGFCTINTGTACSSNDTCNAITAGDTCNLSGICVGPNPLCNFELILSTLQAHSFDFIVSMPGTGSHTIAATWSVVDATTNNSNSNVASCVGPGVLTVTQYKVFQNSGALTFGSL